jgi:hypothetical protein
MMCNQPSSIPYEWVEAPISKEAEAAYLKQVEEAPVDEVPDRKMIRRDNMLPHGVSRGEAEAVMWEGKKFGHKGCSSFFHPGGQVRLSKNRFWRPDFVHWPSKTIRNYNGCYYHLHECGCYTIPSDPEKAEQMRQRAEQVKRNFAEFEKLVNDIGWNLEIMFVYYLHCIIMHVHMSLWF